MPCRKLTLEEFDPNADYGPGYDTIEDCQNSSSCGCENAYVTCPDGTKVQVWIVDENCEIIGAITGACCFLGFWDYDECNAGDECEERQAIDCVCAGSRLFHPNTTCAAVTTGGENGTQLCENDTPPPIYQVRRCGI